MLIPGFMQYLLILGTVKTTCIVAYNCEFIIAIYCHQEFLFITYPLHNTFLSQDVLSFLQMHLESNAILFLCFAISLVMKEEASDYLELETIKNLVKKYSQFINFPIYVWSSKVRQLGGKVYNSRTIFVKIFFELSHFFCSD